MVIMKFLSKLVSPNLYGLINSGEFTSYDKIRKINDDFVYHNQDFYQTDESKLFFINNFGPKGHGIVEISNLPPIFKFSRDRVTSLSFDMCLKNKNDLSKLINENEYGFPGYQRGLEKFNGLPDYAKSSYYFYHTDSDKEPTDKNLYSSDQFKDIIDLEKELNRTVMLIVASNLDLAIQNNLKMDLGIVEFMQKSTSHIHRLLHYHHNTPEEKYESWCGWHNDHGAITVLTPSMLLDYDTYMKVSMEKDMTYEEHELSAFHIDPNSGLYVYSAKKEGRNELQIRMGKDSRGVQLGETLTILSGGYLRATPHYVKGTNQDNIIRTTMASFFEPSMDYVMNVPENKLNGWDKFPDIIPPLGSRFEDKDTFGQFNFKTIDAYYKHNNN